MEAQGEYFSRRDFGHTLATSMSYPSTTQALFALIVMIIVLLFIMVYCCWGTFSCASQNNQEDADAAEDPGRANNSSGSQAVVILPFSSMIYVGDSQRRIYEIGGHDKPPAYSDVFGALDSRAPMPPPYTPSVPCVPIPATPMCAPPPAYQEEEVGEVEEQPPPNPEPPPSYEDYISTSRGHAVDLTRSIENETDERSLWRGGKEDTSSVENTSRKLPQMVVVVVELAEEEEEEETAAAAAATPVDQPQTPPSHHNIPTTVSADSTKQPSNDPIDLHPQAVTEPPPPQPPVEERAPRDDPLGDS